MTYAPYITSRSKVYAEEITGDYQSVTHQERSASVTYSICGKPQQNAASVTYRHNACSLISKWHTIKKS
jgi:hypothetical protein